MSIRANCWPILLLMLCMPGVLHAEDWPAQRRDAGGKASLEWTPPDENATVKEWHFQPRGSRKFKPGLAVWASPALAILDDKPFAFLGGFGQTLYALDLQQKVVVWMKVTNGEIQDAPVIGRVAGREVVYWSSADRSVYAHDARTGERVWTRELVSPTNTMGDAILSAPLLLEGKMYVSCFVFDKALSRSKQTGRLFCLDPEDGAIHWSVEVSQGPVNAPAGRLIDGKAHVFVVARKGLLRCLDVAGEKPREVWQYQMPHEVVASPVLDPDGQRPQLYLGSKFGDLIALDATTGKEAWRRMTGNWVDNNAAVGFVGGVRVVFVGSHDYSLYAIRASDGLKIWEKRLGGEVYSAPSLFMYKGKLAVAVAALDNHLYVIDAQTSAIITSFFTGNPVWDKVTKGETLWGSPVVLEAGEKTALVHGSFSGAVYTLPLAGETSLRAQTQSAAGLWWGLLITLLLFLGVVVPVAVRLPMPDETAPR